MRVAAGKPWPSPMDWTRVSDQIKSELVQLDDGTKWVVPVTVLPSGVEIWPGSEEEAREIGTPWSDLGLSGEGFDCE